MAAVAKSLQAYGFRQPVVVDADGIIIVGHTRWKAAKLLKLDRVPVHIAHDLEPEAVRAYRIADNKTAELAEWDFDLLPIDLKELGDVGYDLGMLGFNQEELAHLLAPGVQQGLTDPDEVPEPPDDAITLPGDLWILGSHRLLCGDSSTGIHSRISKSTWKPYIALNVLLLSLLLLMAGVVFSMTVLEQWRVERAIGGEPVTYQHFFWIAPSATWTIPLYFLVPNVLLMLYLRWTNTPHTPCYATSQRQGRARCRLCPRECVARAQLRVVGIAERAPREVGNEGSGHSHSRHDSETSGAIL